MTNKTLPAWKVYQSNLFEKEQGNDTRPFWIWHPGSFELYHSVLLHNRRTEAKTVKINDTSKRLSVYYPPMWRVDSPFQNAELKKTAYIEEKEDIEFFANTEFAFIEVDGKKYPPKTRLTLEKGEHTVCLVGYKKESFPAFYVKGNVFKSDRSYITFNNHQEPNHHAGQSELYKDPQDIVEEFKFSYINMKPVSVKELNGGFLYDFGEEKFGKIIVKSKEDKEYLLALGESYEEATDIDYSHVVVNAYVNTGSFVSVPVAFRYIFVPNLDTSLDISLDFEFLPMNTQGSFKSDNEFINRLWDICEYTMLLNSREGFFDGIKRDRWVWSGDAYQSYFVNYYLSFDKEIVKRTIRILRGKEPMTKHMNAISDYTFYWFNSIWDYYFFTKDKDFVTDIYPDILDILNFVEGRLSPDGMFERKDDDWVFMDWSTFDPNGPICAEQMLLSKAYDSISKCADLVGDEKTALRCAKQSKYIKEQVNALYWNEEKGAFVDDYKSQRNNVTRHANIFAILFDMTSEERKEKIVKNVIYNKEITPITTPYFEFYELDAMCKIGDFEYMTNMLDSYWGGMLRLGATTIWEEFDPTKNGIEHYEMYGGKYEKSLCHAWGASPIYLLGKYALGVSPTKPGYEEYIVKPNLMSFKEFSGTVPTPKGVISVSVSQNSVCVSSPFPGGTLIINDKCYTIEENTPLKVKM